MSVPAASAIYTGTVRHRRLDPVKHEFRASLFMMYLDLDELPVLFDGHPGWSARRPALAAFRRADYLGDPSRPLGECVRELVATRTGQRPAGPVRVLTNLAFLGYCINPVSFYYCFDDSERVEAVVADVTNTPWGESHAYVMPVRRRADHGSATVLHERLDKELHVSPFMGMDHTYDWRLTEPADSLIVHIGSEREGATVFDATLSLRRREITTASLTQVLLRHPAMTARVAGGIYGHAARLKAKGAPYFRHPRGGEPTKEARTA